jgi:hypothetical protein
VVTDSHKIQYSSQLQSGLLTVLIYFFVADEEDSPVIRGFSDDEPLVIA